MTCPIFMPIMKLDERAPIILSIGGSLIVPNGGPDTDFLKRLKKLILTGVDAGHKFVIVSGGGKTARHYIDAAVKVRHGIENDDLDWLGIHATRLNAHLLRTIFREVAHPVVVKSPLRLPVRWQGSMLIGSGWKPGRSTDYVACRIATRLGAKQVINVSNIDYVYEEDPRKNPNAKPLEALSWPAYRKMVGNKWDPGLSAPFDPVASRYCHEHKLTVAIVNGLDLKRVSNLLEGKKFKGTIISA